MAWVGSERLDAMSRTPVTASAEARPRVAADALCLHEAPLPVEQHHGARRRPREAVQAGFCQPPARFHLAGGELGFNATRSHHGQRQPVAMEPTAQSGYI